MFSEYSFSQNRLTSDYFIVMDNYPYDISHDTKYQVTIISIELSFHVDLTKLKTRRF